MERLIIPCAIIFMLCLLGSKLSAQYSILYNDAASNPLQNDDVNVCQGQTFINTSRIVISSNAADNSTVTITFPPGVKYVPGCLSVLSTNAAITLSEIDISDLSVPVFSISPANLSAGNQFTFQYCRVADCDATAYQMGGGIFKDEIEVCGDAGCTSETNPNLNSYDLLTPSLSMASDGPITAAIGDNVCRSVTLSNGGLGYLDSVKYYIIDGPGTVTTSLTTPLGTTLTPIINGDTLCYWLTAALISEFGDGDDYLENGEQIMLERCYDVTGCSNDSYYGAYWGCPGICMSGGNIQQQTNIPNLVPNLSFVFDTLVNNNFCYKGQNAANGGTAVIQRFELCNTGGGNATNISFELHNNTQGSGVGQNYFTLEAGNIFNDTGGLIGTTSAQMSLDTERYYQADCSRETHSKSVEYELDGIVVAPGKCIFVEIPTYANNLTQECDKECNGDIAWYYFNRSYAYQDGCGINNYSKERAQLANGGRQLYRYDVAMPTDMRDCDEFDLEVNYSNYYNDTKSDNEGSTELKIDVKDTGLLYYGTGTEVYRGKNVTVTQINDTICIKYPPNVVPKGAGTLSLPMKATCSAGGGGKSINLWHEGQYDDACDGSTYHLKCLSRTFLMHCPSPCPKGGATPKLFTLERISLGLEDTDNNGIPDGTGKADPANVELHRASNCDTVKGTWEIFVHPNTVGDSAGVPFNHLYVEFDLNDLNLDCIYYETDNLFTPLPDALATIFPADGSPSYSCLVTPTIEDGAKTNDLAKYDLSICKNEWEGGDSISFCALYVVSTSFHNNGFHQYVADNEVYSSYVPKPTGLNPSDENKYTCDHYNDFMNVYKHYFSPYSPTPQTINGCEGTLNYYLRYYINVQTGDVWYPNEYRPFTIPDKYIIELDDELAYRPGSVKFAGQTVPDADITHMDGLLTICNLKQFFQGYGGPLLESDETWSYNLNLKLDPTCEAQPGLYNTRFSAQVIGNGCHSPDMNYATVRSCSNSNSSSGLAQITYDTPQPFLTGGGTNQFSSSTGCWEVILNNGSNNIDAPFSWFYLEGGSNYVVEDAGGVKINPDANGFYQLGDNPQSNSSTYSICAASSECDTVKINVLSGYGCTAYPSDIADLSCADTVELIGLPLMSEVQLAFETQPTIPMPLCESQSFALKMTSAQAAYLNDPRLSMLIPEGTSISNLKVEYPCDSGNIEDASFVVNGNLLVIDIEAHTDVTSEGLPGTIDALMPQEREACITFDIDTDCDFISSTGILFQAFGKRPCGDPAINNGVRVRSQDLTVDGVNQPHGASVTVSATLPELRGCDVGNEVQVDIDLVSLGSNQTSPNDSVLIILDPGVEFIPGSVACCSADPAHCITFSYATTDAAGYTKIVLAFPNTAIDITNPLNMCFTYEVVNSQDIPCDQEGAMNVQVRASVGDIICTSADGGKCENVQSLTGEKEIIFTTEKTELNLDGSPVFSCTSTGAIEYTIPISIDSIGIEVGEFLVVDIHCVTASATVGAYVQSEVISGPVAEGTTVILSGTVPAGSCNPEYGIIAVLGTPNFDGVDQCICEPLIIPSGALICPPDISHTKEFISVTETGPGEYDVKWTITVTNDGLGDGTYNLKDVPAFDDDIDICSAEYSSDALANLANPGPLFLPNSDTFNLATDQVITGGQVQTYCLIVQVKYDPSADPAIGDGTYTTCEDGTLGNPTQGEGLYNESLLDTNDDGIADEQDEACGDLPCILKIVSAIPSACNTATSTYDLTVTVDYGAAPDCLINVGGQTFVIDSSGSETFVVTGLSADGAVGVTVSAFFTCEAVCFDQISYDAPEECTVLDCSTTQVNILCHGDATGEATVTAMGGFPPYSYSWSTTPSQTIAAATGLTAGTYNVTVTDNDNVQSICSVTISEPTDLTCTVTKNSDISCNNLSDGSATVNPVGGTGAYTYAWSTGETTATATSLVAGSNTVTVTDANNCITTCTVEIIDPPAVTCSITSFINPICAGTATGSIIVSGTGGIGTLEYNIDGGAFQLGSTFNNVSAGAHTITVRDANNCMSTCSQTLMDPVILTCTTVQDTPAACGMNNGQAKVTPVGGTAGYTYLWDNTETTAQAVALNAGTHSVTVTDANGCISSCLVVITATSELECEITANQDVSCNGALDGSATVTATGGTSPYNYLWNNSATTASITGLSGGVYTVTITDATKCMTTCSVTIAEATELICTVVKDNDISCNGSSDGGATVSASGGTPGYTYLWTGGETTLEANDLASGINYVTITDAAGCTTICQVAIVEPVAISCIIDTFANLTCNGNNTGTITASGSGGTGTLEFSVDEGAYQLSGNFTGLAVGSHTITVRDANGCLSSCTQALSEPLVLTCTAVAESPTACGLDIGQATVTPDGGTANYTYLWDNLESTPTATSLSEGTHAVTVTDANNCSTTCQVVIVSTSGLECEITASQNVSCNGALDGSATVAANGGTTPYNYLWSNSATTASITGLSGGIYTVTITDATNCKTTCSVTIAEATELICTVVKDNDISCNGASDGGATVSASGGKPGYTYLWTGGETTTVANALASGTNFVTITDAAGCTSICQVVIIEPVSLSCSIDAFTNLTCNENNSGTITASAAGGAGGFEYSVDGGAYQLSGSFSGIAAGTHTITVRDANGCLSNCSQALSEPLVLTCTAVAESPTACGLDIGQATVTPDGGTANYTYLWDNLETTPTATSLSAGTHTVAVTDANDCTTTCQVVIESTSGLSCEITESTDVTCNDAADGTATVEAAGGTSPYIYNWDNGDMTASVSGLAGGTYVVTITDATNCSTTCSVTIAEATTLLCGAVKNSDVTCNGVSDGVAGVETSGGTPGYTYLWTGGATTSVASNLAAGTNYVTVTDADGCSSVCTVVILEPLALECSIDGFSNLTCNEDNSGTITVSATGGKGILEYSVDGGPFQLNGSFTGLDATIHTITVRDANGCTTRCIQALSEPTELTCMAFEDEPTACGLDNGQASVIANGGIPGYTYLWDNLETTATAVALSAGTHTITLTDDNGCTTTCLVVINSTSGLACEIVSSTNVSCNGASDGSAEVEASGGSEPYSFAWSNGRTTAAVSGLSGGTYDVVITDVDGCTIECTVMITEATELTCSVIKDNDISCNGLTDGGTTVSASGGTPGYSYLWSSSETTVTAKALSAGINSVTITDAAGCFTVCEVTIIEPTPVACSISNFSDLLCNDDSSGTITASGTGGTGELEYSIDGGPFQSGGNFIGLNAGVHTVTVRDAEGCMSTCSQELSEPVALSCTVVAVSETACMMASGSATVTPEGGTAGYTYLWDNLETTPTAVALNAGTHTVVVTDANNCTSSCQIVIGTTSGLSCEITASSNVSCAGAADGSAEVTVEGGSAPYLYTWSDGTTTAAVSGLSGGTYNVIITDVDGCSTDCSVVISEATALLCSVSGVVDISCFGESDGGAEVEASGGVPGYSYAWPSGETSGAATSLAVGVNTVTITDSENCTTTCDVTITMPDTLTCTLTMTPSGCQGQDDGAITTTVYGGITPFMYSINGGANQTGEVFSNLAPGNYSVEVTDANGCSSTCEIEVPVTGCQYDLSLIKKLAPGETGVYDPGDEVEFKITVCNQGQISADSIEVTDYIPTGMVFNASNPTNTANGWAGVAGASIATTISVAGGQLPAGGLLANQCYDVDVIMTVDLNAPQGTSITNYAEISADDGDDMDSTADADDSNDGPAEDDETNNANGDEDDHDPAVIQINYFDLALTKALATGQSTNVAPNDNVTFTITVYNQGTIAADSIEITDYIPSCMENADPNWTSTIAGLISYTLTVANGDLNAGGLAPDDFAQVDITLKVDDNADSSCDLTNWAEISDEKDTNGNPIDDVDSNADSIDDDNYGGDDLINGANGDEDDHDPASVGLLEFDLALSKDLAPGQASSVVPGDLVSYTVTIINQGQFATDSIEITDYIPACMTLADTDWTTSGVNATYLMTVANGDIPAGGLAPNTMATVEITLLLDNPVGSTCNLTNVAEISGDKGEDIDSTPDDNDSNDPSDEDDIDDVPIDLLNFDLALSKDLAIGEVSAKAPGDDITFTISVVNQGAIYADNIEIIDYLPSCTSLNDEDWTNLGATAIYVMTVANGDLPAGGLPPNGVASIDVTLKLDDPIDPLCDMTNWAEIASATDENGMPQEDEDSTPDDDPSNDPPGEDDIDNEPFEILEFDLALSKDLATGQSSSVAPGDLITYTITVINQGFVTTDSIEITDYIPSCMSLADADWTESGANATYILTVADGDIPAGGLVPNAMASIEITLLLDDPVDATCDLTNVAEISGDKGDDIDSTPDGDSGNDPSEEDDFDDVVVELLEFDLALSKDLAEGQSSAVAPGDLITYDIIVINQGQITTDSIEITDYIPSCMTLADTDWVGSGANATNLLTVEDGDIPAGGLAPNEMVSVEITLLLDNPVDASCSLTNVAEISGDKGDDIDSTPDGDDSNDPPNEDDIDEVPVELLDFDLALSKELATGQASAVAPGDDVTFTISVVNQGNITADSIEITDYLPSCTSLNDADWIDQGTTATYILTVADGDIPEGGLVPNGVVSIDITLQLDNPLDAAACDMTNWAEISSATDKNGMPQVDEDSTPDNNPSNDPPGEDDIDDEPFDVLEFDLALSKTLAIGQTSEVMSGDDVTFTFTIFNQGQIPADNIQVTDYIPTDFVLNDGDWAGTNPAFTTLSVLNGDIPSGGLKPGQSTTVDITLTVLMSAVNGDTYINYGEISDATDEDGDPQEDVDSDPDMNSNNDPRGEDDIDNEPLTIRGMCDLSLIKKCSRFESNGDGTGGQIVFDLIVTNQGGCTAYNIGLIDYVLPNQDMVLNDNDWYLSPFGGFPTYNIPGPLLPGELDTVEITFDIKTFDPESPQINFAEITGSEDFNGDDQEDDDSEPNTDPIDDGAPVDDEQNGDNKDEDDHDYQELCIMDLAIEKSLAPSNTTPYAYGDDITFAICVTNEGNMTASSIVIADYIPAGFVYDATINAGWTGTAPSVNYTFAGPVLPGDEVCTDIILEFVSGGASAADYTNVTEITEVYDENGDPENDDWDSTPENDDGDQSEDDEDNEVFEVFDLELDKSIITQGPYSYGQDVVFEMQICNTGSVIAQNVVVEDKFPCGYEFVPSTGWASDGATVKTTITGPLYPSDCETVTLTLKVQACGSPDGYLNVSEITDSEDDDSNHRDDIDSEEDNDDPIEDDQDDELIDIYDLALQKTIDDRGPYLPGEEVEFKFNIYNQGNVEANNIVITDYLNTGFIFTANAANTGWSSVGNYAEYTHVGPLEAGENVTISIFLEVTIPAGATYESWTNEGEISDSDGLDADSNADDNPDNDNDVVPGDDNDDEINEHGDVNDEDDNDVADVLVTGEIGDRVWKDLDNDGIQDEDEPGVADVIVTIYDCNGLEFRKDTTDAAGYYLFDLLLPGGYQLNFDLSNLPVGCAFTSPSQGAEDEDSDADLDGRTTCITLEAGKNNHDVDVGLLNLTAIGNYTWHDLDGDGIQDVGESGLEGIKVKLYKGDGTYVGITTTDSNGLYLFDGLYPGDYYLEFTPSSHYPLTTDANQGSDTELDSDIDNSNGPNTTSITYLSGDADLSWDAGFYKCVPIGEIVWYDLDEDDVLDNLENGINGLEIELYRRVDDTWSLWDSELTGHKPGTPSDDGYFKFCAPPGEYHLKANLPSYGLVAVQPNVGSDDSIDSDFDDSNGPGTSETFSVLSGEEKCDLAAGYYTQASVSSLIWNDENADGVRQSIESIVPGVLVEAYNVYNDLVGSTTTDAEGKYTIDNLKQEGYFFKVYPPNGLRASKANIGSDDTKDSDIDHSNGLNTTDYIMMTPGVHRSNVDIGLMADAAKPFEIVSFSGRYRPDFVELKWLSKAEPNIIYYQIEKRHETDSEFSTLGKQMVKGDDSKYDVYDYDIERDGIYYYRLHAVDNEEVEQISDEISIDITSVRNDGVSIYPNPAVSNVNIEIALGIGKLVKVDIYNTQGELIRASVFEGQMAKGVTNTRIDVNSIPAGIYNVQIQLGEKLVTKRLILLNN